MTEQSFHHSLALALIATCLLSASPQDASAECLRIKIEGEAIAKTEPGGPVPDPTREPRARSGAISAWEASAAKRAGEPFASFSKATGKRIVCKPMARNLRSPYHCRVTGTPCR